MKPWTPKVARRVAEVLRALWFVPALMALAGVALGIVLPRVDAIPDVLATISFGWLRTVLDSAPAGAQQLLAASAGALATVLGVAFSLTLVTLQLAAAQYTPRLVGRLLEDGVTKLVLGSYLGTIAYLLLVLRSVHGVGEDTRPFVPRLSILLALVLILACLGLLAFFVHHLGASIQPANVGARVVAKTVRGIARLERGAGEPVRGERTVPPPDAVRVAVRDHGYLQLVDIERVAAALPRGVTHALVEVSAGDYLLPRTPVLSLWPCRALSDEEEAGLREAFAVGPQRTEDQDVLYGVRQLADIGLKALSPGINDETTAITVVNQLGTVLAAACEAPTGDGLGWSRHQIGAAMLFTPALTVRRIVEDAFAGLVRSASDHPRVLARIVEVLGHVSRSAAHGDAREALLEGAGWVEHTATGAALAPHERHLVDTRLAQLRAAPPRTAGDQPHAIH
jgi:uncharacterized membrane protein